MKERFSSHDAAYLVYFSTSLPFFFLFSFFFFLFFLLASAFYYYLFIFPSPFPSGGYITESTRVGAHVLLDMFFVFVFKMAFFFTAFFIFVSYFPLELTRGGVCGSFYEVIVI